MKYEEIIYELRKFNLSRKQSTYLHDDEIINKMEGFLKQLENADDLSNHHDEYQYHEGLKEELESETLTDLEKLLIKKKEFRYALNDEIGPNVIYYPITEKTLKKLSHSNERIILDLETVILMKDKKDKFDLTITKKIALLKQIGFYEHLESNWEKINHSKITMAITGGSSDIVSRNLKNFYCSEEERNHKYTAFKLINETEDLLSEMIK
jgi:hypothetical protein